MKRNDRLSVALHALLHMAQKQGGSTTSEVIAGWVDANPVVVRRIFAGLREAGIVSSEKGHGGGWRLARAPDEVTLSEVCSALGSRLVTLPEADESPGCYVEQAVHRSLADAVAQANRMLDQRFSSITLAELLADVGSLAAKGRTGEVAGHSLLAKG